MLSAARWFRYRLPSRCWIQHQRCGLGQPVLCSTTSEAAHPLRESAACVAHGGDTHAAELWRNWRQQPLCKLLHTTLEPPWRYAHHRRATLALRTPSLVVGQSSARDDSELQTLLTTTCNTHSSFMTHWSRCTPWPGPWKAGALSSTAASMAAARECGGTSATRGTEQTGRRLLHHPHVLLNPSNQLVMT